MNKKGILSVILFCISIFAAVSNSYAIGILDLTSSNYCEISENINLNGKRIALKKDAVLSFKGGKISNGVLVCDNNILEGHRGLQCDMILSGTIKGPLNVDVFDLQESDSKFDIGQIINMCSSVCKSLIIPEGYYYFKTPIIIEACNVYTQYGGLIYNGTNINTTALSFKETNNAFINVLGSVTCDRKTCRVNYTKSKRTNLIGIDFININHSTINIGQVSYFNNNIRVTGSGKGNCYNQYSLNISAYSNEHLRIYQEDSPNGIIGWCNENTFVGGRFCNWSDFDWANCESFAIVIEGKETGDSYNKANSLLFLKASMEGFKEYAVKARNVLGCHWLDVRTEGCGKFGFFSGKCENNRVSVGYGTSDIDYSKSSTYPFEVDGMFPIKTVHASRDVKQKLKINTEQAKLFKVVFEGEEAKGRVTVRYVESNKKIVSLTDQAKIPSPKGSASSYYLNPSSKLWTLSSDLHSAFFEVPSDVNLVELTIWGNSDLITLYSDANPQVFL